MLKEKLKNIYRFRRVLWDMTIAQFKAKYAGSRLGIWWTIITPVIMAICISVIFTVIFKITIQNYSLFVLAGILPWLFFTNALAETTNSFLAHSAILKQSTTPREFIPISCVLSNLFNFFIGLLFLLPLFVIFHPRVFWQLWFLLVIILLHFLFVLGLGLLCSSINVFFRDLTHFLSIGFMVWFWITPVFYSLEMLSFPIRWACLLNPMTYYVVSYKRVLFAAEIPALSMILVSLAISLLSLIIGYLFFLKNESAMLKKI